jgi:hypothetical protein
LFLKRPTPSLYCLAKKKQVAPHTNPTRTPLIEPAIAAVLLFSGAVTEAAVIFNEFEGVLVVVLVAVADCVAEYVPAADCEASADNEADDVAAALIDLVAELVFVADADGSGPNKE